MLAGGPTCDLEKLKSEGGLHHNGGGAHNPFLYAGGGGPGGGGGGLDGYGKLSSDMYSDYSRYVLASFILYDQHVKSIA